MEDFFSEMVNFVVFFVQQFYFLETVASVAVIGFADIVAGVDGGVDNNSDPVAVVVDCDFLLT